MTPIHGRYGEVLAWLKGDQVISLTGEHLAFLRGVNVYSYSGEHLGTFDQGFFRDHSGGCVAYVKGARGGPVKPIRKTPPIPPISRIAPIRPIPSIPPISPIRKLQWGINWNQFIGSDR